MCKDVKEPRCLLVHTKQSQEKKIPLSFLPPHSPKLKGISCSLGVSKLGKIVASTLFVGDTAVVSMCSRLSLQFVVSSLFGSFPVINICTLQRKGDSYQRKNCSYNLNKRF